MTNKNLRISIAGAGAVGCTIGRLLQKNGHSITGISTKTKPSLEEALSFLDLSPESGDVGLPPGFDKADLVFVTVPDDQILTVAETLAGSGRVESKQLYLHCSGAHRARDVLAPLTGTARTGSFHPLQTIPDPETGVNSLPGSWVAVNASDGKMELLHDIARAMNLESFFVPDEKRPLYHAAAVFSCNHALALFSFAEQLMDASTDQLENPLKPLAPLIRSTVENAVEEGPGPALTGPAARGDVNTLVTHLEQLDEHDSSLVQPYRILTERCLEMAREEGDLSAETVREIRSKLAGATEQTS